MNYLPAGLDYFMLGKVNSQFVLSGPCSVLVVR